jgi:hypothetical protein
MFSAYTVLCIFSSNIITQVIPKERHSAVQEVVRSVLTEFRDEYGDLEKVRKRVWGTLRVRYPPSHSWGQ